MLIMWNLVILFIVFITNVVSLRNGKKVHSPSDIDADIIKNVLNRQQNHNGNYLSQHYHAHSSDSKSSDDVMNTADNSHYGSLKSREILDLIEQASHDKYVDEEPSPHKIMKEMPKHKLHNLNDVINRKENQKSSVNFSLDERTLNQILLYLNAQMKPKKKPQQVRNKQKLIKNIFKPAKLHGDKHDRASIDDYSKIYVILNPHTIQKSGAEDSLSEIISQITSLSSASSLKERAVAKQNQRYKGFPVKEGVFARRARRDSREKYDVKDSLEDVYKQKRSRNDHGGGRTAIPYIRHRGDIYERDI